MSFHTQLLQQTEQARMGLLSAPIIQGCLRGEVSLPSYVAFLREARERWPQAVRILISGYSDSQDIIAGVNEAGIWQYLLKPWQPEQLLLTLQRAAEVWRLQQENQRLSIDLTCIVVTGAVLGPTPTHERLPAIAMRFDRGEVATGKQIL